MTTFFTQTSEAPYDKYDYEVVHKNKKRIVFDNHYDMSHYWYNNSNILECVNILNKKTKPKTKGFK